MEAYVQISVEPTYDQYKLYDELLELPEVKEVHIVLGDWDIIIKADCPSPEELGSFVVAKLRPLGGVKNTKTLIIAN